MKFLTRLRQFGESLFTAKKPFIAEQALPDYDSVTDLDQATEVWTATADGYVKILRNSVGYGFVGIRISQYDKFNVFQTVYKGQLQSGYKSQMVPCKKGSMVVFTQRDTDTNTTYLVKPFFSLMGGGGKFLKIFSLKGGLVYV